MKGKIIAVSKFKYLVRVLIGTMALVGLCLVTVTPAVAKTDNQQVESTEEKARKAEVEKTRKAEVEKTRKAEVEKARKAAVEKVNKQAGARADNKGTPVLLSLSEDIRTAVAVNRAGKPLGAENAKDIAIGVGSTADTDLAKAAYDPSSANKPKKVETPKAGEKKQNKRNKPPKNDGTNAVTGTNKENKPVDAIAGKKPVGEVSVGTDKKERRITHMAAGAAATDAVNVSQLRAGVDYLNSNIKKNRVYIKKNRAGIKKNRVDIKKNRDEIDENRQGIALAMAVEIPTLGSTKKFGLTVGAGQFKDKVALGISGVAQITDSLSGYLGVGIGVNDQDVASKAGLMFTW